jgi:hypothetical protein
MKYTYYSAAITAHEEIISQIFVAHHLGACMVGSHSQRLLVTTLTHHASPPAAE